MKVSAIAPWFGGKRNLAPEIVAELGPHTAYWEPFCGSMAVLLAKPQCTMETVNDLHGELINLARVIRDEQLGAKLYRRLRRSWMSRDLQVEVAERCKARKNAPAEEVPSLDRAYDYFLASWMGRNGVSGTNSYNQKFCLRFTKNGGHAAKRLASAVESIPAWRRRMRNVTILNDDAFSLLERIEDAKGVAIYCDPPYLVKGAKYVHDFSASDHVRLAELLHRFKRTRVVVSYYDDPRLDELYPGLRKRSIAASKALVNQGRRDAGGAVVAPEVLFVNSGSQGELF